MRMRDKKGRWTPNEFFLLPGLNFCDRYVLSCIYGLDDNGCTAGDSYIAKLIAATKIQVRDSIKKMQKLGFIQVECFRGKGILGTQRKIYCKIMVETPSSKVENGSQNHPMKSLGGFPDHLMKPLGGIGENHGVVLEGLQSKSKPQTTVFSDDTVDIQKNSTVQKGNSHKELGEENTPYQTQVETHKMEWRQTMGKHLTSFASKAMSLGKPLQFGGKGAWVEEEFNRLVHRHGEERLLIVLRASVSKCGPEYPTLSFNFFKSKIAELRLNEIPQMVSGNVVKKTEAEQMAEFRRMGLGSRAIPKLTTQQNV